MKFFWYIITQENTRLSFLIEFIPLYCNSSIFIVVREQTKICYF